MRIEMKEIGIRIMGLSAAMLALAACSSDSDVVGNASERCILTIDAQVEQTVTRAGQTGVMDNTTLASTGFGVFIYGKNGTSDLLAAQQLVTYANGDTPTEPLSDVHLHPRKWSYGTQHDWAEGEKYDFFAYAPYTTDFTSPGITNVAGSADGPTVSYTVAINPAQSIDLLWGVRGETGLPWLNQTRESNGGLVLFNFRHALAAIGLHVQAMIDKDNDLIDFTDVSDPNNLLGTNALKVTLQGITITPKTNSFYNGGTLNLNNSTANTPRWTPGSRSLPNLTLSSSNINVDLTDGHNGILKTADSQEVINNGNLFMVLPDGVAQDYEVSVEYTVRYKTGEGTYNTLAYTSATGALGARTATFSNLPLVAGIKYWLNLVIGLKSVSINVTATDWEGQTITIEEIIERGTSANSSLSRHLDN